MSKYTEYSHTTGITKHDGQSTTEFPNVYTAQTTTIVELQQLQSEIRDFAARRDWDPFHTPRNLCLALGGELGELVEQLFLLDTIQTDKLYQEVADVTIYLLRLADVCQLSLLADTSSADDETDEKLVSSFSIKLPSVASTEEHTFPVGLIRNHILELWMHWTRHDKESFYETLQTISTLLGCCPNTPPMITSCANSKTAWLSLLCLLGELSDQFQFLGDAEQPLHKHEVICSYIQQMVHHMNDEVEI
jgi:NTP pyrophosphatase (non-canonical NTP hydrolase)